MDDQRDTLNAKFRARWKTEQRRLLTRQIIRRGIGVPLLVFAFPIPWFGPFLVLLGAILIAPDIAGFLSGFAGNILWPHQIVEPKPLYSIPESLVARGEYAKAEAEYEKIIKEFPAEAKPHIDMINIAVTRLNDKELAEKLYERGMSILQDPAPKETLTKMYDAISTMLKPMSSIETPDVHSTR